ncbi:hypothetical protein POTOM_039573 [Populus tomentosa]|uniref:Retrotransposon gag domain-containing protein n=1 Tax=Populus tomentosa TaxID=118781 RepID=A0A8X7YRY2_POPTO|nr:hypothetical protein POTOM_039573 [Populus tomentosa]
MVSEPEMDSSTSFVLPMSSAPEGHGLLGYVTNKITCPDSTIAGADGVLQPNPAAATWLRTDQLILGWINSSLSDGLLSQVINSKSCHDAWTVLETLYGSHTRDRIQQMKGELQTLSKGSYSLEDYLPKAKSLSLSLRGAGKPMDDDDLILLSISLLMSLYSGLLPVLISYGFLAALVTLYCPLLVDPSWITNQYVVFSLVTQLTTRDIVAWNHTLVTLPKSLEHHALSRPPPSLPTNEVSVTYPTTYQSSEFQPKVVSPSRPPPSLPTNEVFATEPTTYQSSEFQPEVVSPSPTESTNILPSRIHPMVTHAQTGNLKPKSFFTTRHPIPLAIEILQPDIRA